MHMYAPSTILYNTPAWIPSLMAGPVLFRDALLSTTAFYLFHLILDTAFYLVLFYSSTFYVPFCPGMQYVTR